jgi:hypothetical protein
MTRYTRVASQNDAPLFAAATRSPRRFKPLDLEAAAYRHEQRMRFEGRRPEAMAIYEGINRGDFSATALYRALNGKDFT